jgi:hypothetical protein
MALNTMIAPFAMSIIGNIVDNPDYHPGISINRQL